MFNKSNIPENEAANMTCMLIVEGGSNTAISALDLPGKYINDLENILETIFNYLNERNGNGEKK